MWRYRHGEFDSMKGVKDDVLIGATGGYLVQAVCDFYHGILRIRWFDWRWDWKVNFPHKTLIRTIERICVKTSKLYF